MAFDVLDEHEQGELVQKWLRENALSIATGIVLGLVLLFGWQQWKAHRARHAADAAIQYQSFVDAVDAKHNDDATKIADALRKDYSDSAYAVFAAMRSAELSTASGDLKGAADDLAWAEDHAGAPALKSLVAIDRARINLALGDAEAALSIIDAVPKDSYVTIVGELRGDILAKLGRTDDARKAYEDALTHIEPQAPNRSFVQMKLDDLGAPPPPASTAPAPAPETSGS
jgi:predicted negative regulator of RcsB-dependent stress response